MKNTVFTIYTKSNEHPRTINSYQNSRTYYTKHTANGKTELLTKLEELTAKGETINEIVNTIGRRYYYINGKIYY